jgi:hypothetical protein
MYSTALSWAHAAVAQGDLVLLPLAHDQQRQNQQQQQVQPDPEGRGMAEGF